MNYIDLLKMLKDKTFKKTYPDFGIGKKGNSYILQDEEYAFIVFESQIKVIIRFENNRTEEFNILSTLDINKYCKKKEINLNRLYSNLSQYNPKKTAILLEQILNNELTLYFKEKEKLDEINHLPIFVENEIHTIKEYSNFYKDYFGEDLSSNDKFIFEENETRSSIFNNLNRLHYENLQMYKFTGPYSIGKSITLLRFCRLRDNAFYINLKVLNTKKEKEKYKILKEEFARISETFFDDVQALINKNYYNDVEAIETVINIMEYLGKFKNDNLLFALDQYKSKYFDLRLQLKLEKLSKNIKLVFCSSINDNSMKKECLSAWKKYGKTPSILTEDNQDKYFYYSNIYKRKNNDNSLKGKLNGISKLIKLYDKNKSESENMQLISEHIYKKIKEYNEPNKCSLDFALTNIKNIINNKYKLDKLEDAIKYCSLKYFIVEFEENEEDKYFQMKIQFPFLKYVINKKLTEIEVDKYFQEEKYLKLTIENESVKGDYFECSAKFGLKEHIKLPKKIEKEYTVTEIITMDKLEKSNFEFEDDEKEEINNGENKEELNNHKDSDNIPIENNDSINNINISNNQSEINLLNEENSQNLKNLLNDFSIEENNNKNNEIDSDNDDNNIGNTIEDYRYNALCQLKKNKYKVPINKEFTGNENIFIDQKKKKGRILDYALLYGDRKSKIFIGFQMKCYFEQTKTINDKVINKKKIKENCQQILINSMGLFNCKIVKWHYFLIFYYNNDKKEYNVNQSIIDKAINEVEILFYDPIKKLFLDKNHSHYPILKISDYSDLDKYFVYFRNNIIDSNILYKAIDKPIFQNEEETNKLFIKDFDYLKKQNLKDIKETICKFMDINGKLGRIDKLNKMPIFRMPPNFDHIFLEKKKYKESFVGMKTIPNNELCIIKYYDLEEKKKKTNEITEDIYDKSIDKNFDYFYSVLVIKKRTYNDLSTDKSNMNKDLRKMTKKFTNLKFD